MSVADVLDYFARHTREMQADLWTLREAIDAHLSGRRHARAVTALAELGPLYDDATNTVRALAADLGIRLDPDRFGVTSC
jgi:hypothetical protein